MFNLVSNPESKDTFEPTPSTSKTDTNKNKRITQTVSPILSKMPKLSSIKSELELRESTRMVILVNKVPVRVSWTPEPLNQIKFPSPITQLKAPTATAPVTLLQKQANEEKIRKPYKLKTEISFPVTYTLDFLDKHLKGVYNHEFTFEVGNLFSRINERDMVLKKIVRPELFAVIYQQRQKGIIAKQLMAGAISAYPKPYIERGTKDYIEAHKKFCEKSELFHRCLKSLNPPLPFLIEDATDEQQVHIKNCVPCQVCYGIRAFNFSQMTTKNEILDFDNEVERIKKDIENERPLKKTFYYNRFNLIHEKYQIDAGNFTAVHLPDVNNN